MILYFANRQMEILGHATTNLPGGFVIIEDLKAEEIETGVASFECRIGFDVENRLTLEEYTEAGNYLLRSNGDENEFYTIIETEIDTDDHSIYIYAEDAGLDLLNEVVGEYAATETHNIEYYVNKFTSDSGFEIGICEVANDTTRKLSWDGESTVTERLASIATQFGGCEVSYSFDIKGMEITNKYINIFKERGKDVAEELRLNHDINRIVTKKSIANIATALQCTGGTPENSEKPITLSGYEYDDGEFYVEGKLLCCRSALEKWSRHQWEDKNSNSAGHIIKLYSYDTLSQKTLCSHAITELKKICDTEINYEVDIANLPENIKIGDRVNIVDEKGELYLSARILLLETSVTNRKQTATLGEYLLKKSGISSEVELLAEQFASLAYTSGKLQTTANNANTTAEVAKEIAASASENAATAQELALSVQDQANDALTNSQTAQEKAESALEEATTAKTAANNAATEAKTAQSVANDARKVATNYLNFDSNGLVVGDMTASTLGKNVLINSEGVDIRNNNTVLAQYLEDYIYLGKNARTATIDLCNGLSQLYNQGGDDEWNRLVIYTDDAISLSTNGAIFQRASYSPDAGVTEFNGEIRIETNTPWSDDGIYPKLYLTTSFTDVPTNTVVYSKIEMCETEIKMVSSNPVSATGSESNALIEVSGFSDSITISAKYIDVLNGVLKTENNVLVGGRNYNTNKAGIYMDANGYMQIHRNSESNHPYISFSYGDSTEAQGMIRVNVSNGYMQFLNAPLYYFDKPVRTATNLQFGTNSAETMYSVTTIWNDGSYHNALERAADGLTASVGWAGSSSYATVTKLRGRTCQVANASGTSTLSDERLKEEFTELDNWEAFYDSLEPCAFKLKGGSSGRFHAGFKAQQVEQALLENGLTTQDFAGFVKMPYVIDEDDPERTALYESLGIEEGSDEYGLIYTEFVALNTYKIQKLQKEVTTLKNEIESLKKAIAA